MSRVENLPTEVSNNPKISALSKAGITREKTFLSLYEHLTAVVHETVYDEKGNPSTVEVPNYPVQEKAQEKILRITGDIKPTEVSAPMLVRIGATPEEVKALIDMAIDVREQLASLSVSGRQTGEVIDVTEG